MRIFILFLFFFTTKSQNIYVYDGDTFKYNDLKIRLYNIDALEKKQPHSEESYYFLKKILKNKALKYIILKYDRYGRAICKVYVNDKGLSLLMVETGNTFVYRRYCSSFIFLSAEKEAKRKKLGIWMKRRTNFYPYDFTKLKFGNRVHYLISDSVSTGISYVKNFNRIFKFQLRVV